MIRSLIITRNEELHCLKVVGDYFQCYLHEGYPCANVSSTVSRDIEREARLDEETFIFFKLHDVIRIS